MIPKDGNQGKATPDRLLYPVEEVATLLGVTGKTVWNLIYGGELTSRKLGRRRLVHRDDLNAYIGGLSQALPSSADAAPASLEDVAA